MSWPFIRFAMVAGMTAGMLFVSVALFHAGYPLHGSIYAVSALIWGAGTFLAARAGLRHAGITISAKVGGLDGNHHGPKVDGEATTLRSTFQFVQLDNGLNPPPRYFWGLRLWVYAPSGRCWNIDIAWRSARRAAESEVERERRAQLFVEQQKARGDWPPQGPAGPDYLGAMLGAVGLGLTITERPAPVEPDERPACPRCRGCGEMDAGGGRCVVCHGSGLEPDEPELPEGVWQHADGTLMFECRGCDRAVELMCDPSEFDPAVAYCGGSPRCLP